MSQTERADHLVLSKHGDDEYAPHATRPLGSFYLRADGSPFAVDLPICRTTHPARTDGPSNVSAPAHRTREGLLPLRELVRRKVVVSRCVDLAPVYSVDVSVDRATQPDGVLYDRVENRLHVRRRARDHSEDLAGRRLLLERLGHLGVRLRE